MFTVNPFYDLLELLTPTVMQIYVVAMFLAVIGGTIHRHNSQKERTVLL